MVGNAEEFYQALEIPYRMVAIVSAEWVFCIYKIVS